MRFASFASFLVCWGMTVGCATNPDDPVFEVRDSAGVTIVENHRPGWTAGDEWTLGPDPILRLGLVDGESPLQFDGVTGVARTVDGGVVVADGGSQEVRFFDSAGSLRARVGGKGEGPGEFTGLSGLGPAPNGTLWAYDFSLRRVTWMNGAGEVEGITSLGPEPPVLNAVGVLPDGSFLLKQLWGASVVAEAREAGLRRDPVAYVRFGRDGVLVDTVGMFPGRQIFLLDEGGRGVMATPPFARNSVGTPWGDGLVVGTQEGFELMRYGQDGKLGGVVRIPSWPVALQPGDLEEYIEGRMAQVSPERRPGVRQELEAMPVPDTKPGYGAVLADEAGNLWVSDWAASPHSPRRWTVLDPSGHWLGSVSVPNRFYPYAIGSDWIGGVERDDLDVEYVVLYPLEKKDRDG